MPPDGFPIAPKYCGAAGCCPIPSSTCVRNGRPVAGRHRLSSLRAAPTELVKAAYETVLMEHGVMIESQAMCHDRDVFHSGDVQIENRPVLRANRVLAGHQGARWAVRSVVSNAARAYPWQHFVFQLRRSVMSVKADIQHPKKAGAPGRKASSTSRRSIALDPAVLYLVAVLACAIALVLCAALGDSVGVGGAATALVGVLTVRASSGGKAL